MPLIFCLEPEHKDKVSKDTLDRDLDSQNIIERRDARTVERAVLSRFDGDGARQYDVSTKVSGAVHRLTGPARLKEKKDYSLNISECYLKCSVDIMACDSSDTRACGIKSGLR